MATPSEVSIAGRRLSLSNLDKVLYPQVGFTKAQVIDYYVRVAPVLLPHLRDRPLTLKRYPDGVEGEFFYEKNCPRFRPDWVRTVPLWSEGNQRHVNFCLVNDLASLVWVANLADLELHTPLSLAGAVARPTLLAFDLDPGAPADIVQCCEVALLLRQFFDPLGLQSFPKTSGSKGLQVYVPLNAPRLTYDDTKAFARALAENLEQGHPDLVVSSMKKSLRVGKVLVDWSQNDEHKTTICAYSLRAKERPTVSTPVTWDEVEACARRGKAEGLVFDWEAVLRRIAERGDLFAPVLTMRQRLPRAASATSR
ncbi:MAG: ATP-dependent DNA ligase [Deltaproteobacteria bacterium]|nr:ATP-dependent DNA ligase [Deltaproteobacteria bacterium]